MKNLFEMLQAIFGKNIISKTIGTRTNVIKLPSNKSSPLKNEFDVFRSAENPEVFQKLKKVIEDEAPYISRMNDAERLIYEGNVKRLHDYLVSIGEIKPTISAEVIGLGTKEPIAGKGLVSLVEEAGQTSPPGTLVGDIQSRINKLKGLGKEMEKQTGEKATLTDVLRDLGASQQSMSRLNDEGLVRAAARQILINDIKAGKIKNITVSEAINMGEPLDPFRQIYGEGALEQLDSLIPNFRGLKTEMEAEKFARSKFKFEPDENRLPGSVSIEEGRKAEQEFGINKPAKVSDFKAETTKRTSIDDLIDEYNANQDRLRLSDEEGGTAISYEEFQKIQKRNEDIAKALEEKGISSKVEEKPEAEIIPFRKKPEEFATGGSVGLDYLTGQEPPEKKATGGMVERKNYAFGSLFRQLIDQVKGVVSPVAHPTTSSTPEIPLTVAERYNKYLSQPSASNVDLGGGGLSDLFRKLISKVAVAVPQTTTSTNDQLYNLYRSGVDGKANGGRIGFKIGSGKKILKALGFNTRSEFEKLNLKHDKDIVKAADEIGANLDDPKMGAQQIAEVYADMKFGKDYYDLSENQQLDLYSKAYNYLTDMGLLRRQSNAVTKYNAGEELGQFDQKMIDQINDRQQKEILNNFDIKNREPNAKGGSVGLGYLIGE